jgi:TPR repeat protein
MPTDLARTTDAFRWRRRLGDSDLVSLRRPVGQNVAYPDVRESNHIDGFAAETAEEIDAVFEAMDQAFAHTRWRVARTDRFIHPQRAAGATGQTVRLRRRSSRLVTQGWEMPFRRNSGAARALRALAGLAIAFCALTSLMTPVEAAGRRVALVIGNAAYESLPQLANTTHDAKAVQGALQSVGFEVYYGADLARLAFEDLLKRFYRAADGAEIALVYYSGHGVQVAGANYVVPVDAKLATAYDIELQTINVDDIYQYLAAHSRAQLIFLDACRTNPFRIQQFWVADTLKAVGATAGLARSAANVGSLIAFSTEPGKVAYDGAGETSPYTTAFVSHVTTPNQEIRQSLTQVRRDVIAVTGGQQVPWENSSLVDDIYLVRAPAPPEVDPMVRIDVGSQSKPIALNIPAPHAETSEPLKVQIDRLPDKGRLLLDGKPLKQSDTLTVADLDRLLFDPAGAPKGAIGLLSYVVSDPWNQSTRGVIAIAIGSGSDSGGQQAEAEQRQKAQDAARDYFKSLDRFEGQATIGVGPAPIKLAAAPAGQSDAGLQVELASASDVGSLYLGDRLLTAGSRLNLTDVSKLAFAPKVGAEDRTASIALTLVATPPDKVNVSISPIVDPCDLDAGAPLDLQGVGPGKPPNDIDAQAATKACQVAVDAHPAVPRFLYQLGRAQLAAGLAEDARRSFMAAAEKKHMRAIEALGDMELFGVFGEANPARAAEYYKACAAGGDAYCLHSYGKAMFYGQGVPKQTSRGLALMIRAAELGHTYAMNELGYIFSYGRGVSADVERGIRYYEAGAARGDIYSYNDLGLIYLNGAGRPRDYAKARDYFIKAADGGHPYAPTNLGRMYRDGTGGPVDLAAAAKWLELGAKRGDYWGALDRARLNRDPADGPDTATYLALAVSLNVDRGNSDPQGQAAHALATLAVEDKKKALAKLEAELGAESAQISAATLDDRLVEVSRRLWRRGKPRYDLF